MKSAPTWELSGQDHDYPSALKDMDSPLPHLYGVGKRAVLTEPCISIIGARKASPYGLACAQMAGRIAAECGLCVVSGGAIGCDCEAARAAIQAGGHTIIIPGCGADVVYPRSHDVLFCSALDHEGCILSIEPWGTHPARYTYVKRNQIIAALSPVLLVCEAGRPSGTFGTALAATTYSRRVYAVPGSIFAPQSRGTNWLIESGAAIIPDEESLESLIALDYGHIHLVSARTQQSDDPLIDALRATPLNIDELAQYLKLDISSAFAHVSDYEASGSICRLADGRFTLTQRALLGQNDERTLR